MMRHLLALILAFGILTSLLQIFSLPPAALAGAPQLLVDGASYFASAIQMIQEGRWIFPIETYHSAGMQLLTSWLFRGFGPNPAAVMYFNLACYLTSLLLIYRISLSLGRTKEQGLLAAALLSACAWVQMYVTTLQYEVVALMLLLFAIHLFVNNRFLAFSVAGALLCFFRLHFVAALLPFPIYLWLQRNSAAFRTTALALTVCLGAAFAGYSIHFGNLSGFQSFPPGTYQRWLCLGAEGSNFPYLQAAHDSVCGSSFVFGHPGEYLILLGRRFLYWTGLLQDAWWVAPLPFLPVSHETQVLIGSLVSLMGIALFLYALGRALKNRQPKELLLGAIVICSGLPFLVAGASTRFLIPVIPVILLLVSGLVKFRGAPKHLAMTVFLTVLALSPDASASCLSRALLELQSQPLVSQNADEFAERGLVAMGQSNLCGPACASYLMEAVRKAEGVSSKFSSPVDEITALSESAYFLGENVVRNGMTPLSLKTALKGDLAIHGIEATVIAKSTRTLRQPGVQFVNRFEAAKLFPSGTASIVVVQHPGSEAFHALLVKDFERGTRTLRFIDPLSPNTLMKARLTESPAGDLGLSPPGTGTQYPFFKITDILELNLKQQ